MYKVRYDPEATEQLKKLEKSGRKVDIKKVFRFAEQIEEHPRVGIGHPKPLSDCPGDVWSRTVNEKDRFVYEIFEEEKEIAVTQVLGHYKDK